MFNKKYIEKIGEQKNRINELEEVLCPCGQHKFIVKDVAWRSSYPDDVYQERLLQCKCCKKVVRDNDQLGSFKYETETQVIK